MAHQIVDNLANGQGIPDIQIIPQSQLKADGAFGNNTIYISQDLLNPQQSNPTQVVNVLLEEMGHYLDSQINIQDAPGDEGAIFAKLVQNQPLAPGELIKLKAEDDHGIFNINGQNIAVEHADTPGVFSVDNTGKISIDFLADSGSYHNEMAIFSLQNMDNLTPGSVDYIKEAARRALSNSTLGYTVIVDINEGAKFVGEIGESNKNDGNYSGLKTFSFTPGGKIAFMLVPQGTVQQVFDNPNAGNSQRPLFSIAAANPNNATQIGQLVPGTFGWEDIRNDQNTDADYNDIIFQIKGATGSLTDIGGLFASGKDWRNVPLAKELIAFASQDNNTTLTAKLSQDTGISNLDGITNNSEISGSVNNADNISKLQAKFSDGSNFVDILSELKANSSFVLNKEKLAQIKGGQIADGNYQLNLRAEDKFGNISEFLVKFTLDTTKPGIPTEVGLKNDGDRVTNQNTPTITGNGENGALIELFDGQNKLGQTTVVNGFWEITTSQVTDGLKKLTITATDISGNQSDASNIEFTIDSALPQINITNPQTNAILNPGARLQGTVNGTGSTIDKLSYRFGNGSEINVPVNNQGAFDVELNLTGLSGQQNLIIKAIDLAGNNTETTQSVVIGQPIGFMLDTLFDSAPIGDSRTIYDTVNLLGQTDANATVTLQQTGTTTTADAAGKFKFTGVSLALGDNSFTVNATNTGGNTGQFTTIIKRVAQDNSDAVLDWNATLLNAIYTDKSAPPVASRNMAIVQTAIFDAINSFTNTYKNYHFAGLAPTGASIEAAAASAAYRTLVNLYPTQIVYFDSALAASLAQIADGAAEDAGVTFGRVVADDILAFRSTDGSSNPAIYIPGTTLGDWQPSAPSFGTALLPNWGLVNPFGLTSGSQFRPSGDPALTSDQYTADFNQVKDLGSLNSTTRTADQTEIAKFWADGAGTYTPPGHWNQIAENIVANQGNSLLDNARLFALLNIGLADAGIAAWDAKYTYNSWRPITAIQQADTDGNSNTLADPNWKPLIITPPFPEYVSGHSTFSGTAETILSALLGSDISFTTNSLGTPGIYRTFSNFTSAANEAGISRIYGGIHFYFSNVDGLATGRSVGNYILQNALAPVITLTTLSNNSTIENVPADSLIGAFNTTSESNRFTYSLVAGVGSTDNVAFTLINNQLHIVSSPDFETKSTYSIRVRTTDRDGSYAEKIFTISILDVNENLNPLVIAAQLQQDTGSNSTDKITSNPAITGTITAAGTIVELKAGFGTTASFDILSNYSNGNFTLDANRLNQIAGGTLTEGLKTLKISAMDNFGNLNLIDFGFTLDTNAPLFPSFGLAPAFDTSPVGDSQTTAANVTLTGQTEANTTVTLFVAGQTTGTTATADASGKFAFANVALDIGANAFTVEAKDIAGNISTFATTVTRAEIPPEVIQLSVKPGEQLKIDSKVVFGKTANFSLFSDRDLPISMLQGDGTLTFKPTPDQVGTYQFNLIARDGSTVTTQEFNLNVVADPNTTTRISGVIKNTDGLGLEGVIVTIGNFSVTTGSDGLFILTLPEVPPDGTALIIQPGQEFNGVVYPSIAEPLPLLLGHDVYGNVANIIDRLIYLPAIDVANAQTINPTIDQTVTSAAIPGSSVFVAANSLFDREGYPYTEQLSITKVPTALTPAALPSNLFPDLVVTIQPGEMRFSTPAPLSLPNLAGYPVGTLMDLWSINPVTGSFDNVGTGQVSADGLVVNTISGGIRNSSWHFFAPPPPTPKDPNADPRNPDDGCDECKATAPATSEVQLHSGAVIETHELISYQSQGVSRGLTLKFDSERADARPILHFGYNNVQSNSSIRLMAELSIRRGDFSLEVPGFAGEEYFGLFQGYNFWSIPNGGGSIDAALQADLRDLASGRYDYDLNSGLMQFATDPSNGFPVLNGSTSSSQGKFLHVNTSNSNFGSGWGLSGLEELVVNPDGSVLIINGDGGEVLFEKKADNSYDSPPGDYSVLEQLSDGTFRRTMKDETVYSFNSDNLLTKVSDRDANETKYIYQNRNLIKMVDPVGLETTFGYSGGKITTITDPAGRSTNLTYDSNGNLTKITDPDGTSRTWEYDANHHMIAEVDKRGDREQTFYDFAGRAKSAIRKDGSVLTFDPIQVQGLYEANRTISPVNAPSAFRLGQAASTHTDANGNQTATLLDRAGQAVSATDAIGALPSVQRNQDNLVSQQTDGRGNITSYTYDDNGNVLTVAKGRNTEGTILVIRGEADSFVLRMEDNLKTLFQETGFNTIITQNVPSSLNGFTQIWDIRLSSLIEPITDLQSTQYLSYLQSGGELFLLGENQSFESRNNSILGLIKKAGGGELSYLELPFVQNVVSPFGFPNRIPDGNISYGGRAAGGVTTSGTGRFVTIDPATGYGTAINFDRGSLSNAVNGGLTAVFDLNFFADANSQPDSQNLLRNLIQLNPPTLPTRTYTYETIFNQVTSETDEIGRKTLYDIDPITGNVRRTTRVVGEVGGDDDLITSYTYTAQGLQDIIIDPMGKIVDYDYDSQGRVIKITFAKGTIDEATQQFEYDLAGNQSATIDELGRHTEYRYDLVNRLIETIYPDETPATLADNPRTKSEYDAVGNQIATIDELGRRSTFTYDKLDRLIKTTEPDPDGAGALLAPETRYEYDAIGNQTAMVDQLGRRTQYQYDARNRLIATIHPDSSRETSIYDADNNLTVSTDANGNNTSRQYDSIGRLVRITKPNGSSTFEYDNTNQLIAQTDANGNRTQYVYDEVGRRIRTIDAAGGVTVTSYDKNGDVIAQTDALNHTTTYSYDNRDRQIKTTFAKGTTDEANQQIEYDAAGNQTASIDELGRRTEYRYDARNRLIETIYPDDTLATLADNSRSKNEFDLAGNQVASIDELGRRTGLEYDALNRLVKLVNPDPDGAGPLLAPEMRYEYDASGNKTAEIDPLGRKTQYQYDNRNRLISKIYPDGSQETSTYDANNNLIATTDANGNVTTRQYDASRRLVKIIEPNGIQTFEYDNNNQLKAQTDANGNLTQYFYDQLGRRYFTIDALGGTVYTSYDKNGNVIAQSDQLNRTTIFSYDNRDRQTTTTTPLGFNSSKVYDAVGNITSTIDANNHATNYRFDVRNRQIEAIDALNQSTKTTYDAVGNVVATTNQLNQTSTYQYDNLNRRIEAIDLLNQSTKTEYDLFGNVIAIVDPLGQRTGYGYDLKNRKNTVTDALGKVTTTRYDAFGNVLSIIDSVNNQTSYEYSVKQAGKKIVINGSVPALSSDGRYIALSIDSSLDSKDTNSLTDVFRLDRQTGEFIRVSANPNGDAPNAYSYNTSISNDGRFVAFYSTITGLDGTPISGLYLRDIENQTTSMIALPIGNNNQELNDYNKGFAISGDGQYIAFVSSESDIVSGDTNGVSDLFVKNIQTGVVERISISSNGDESDLGLDQFAFIDISDDGRYVVFSSNATNLVDNDTNGVADVFVHDRDAGTTSRVSVSSSGSQADGRSYYHSISGDGRYVAFTSDAPNLSGRDGSFVFVHDLQTGTTTQIAEGFAPSIDRDGRFLTFSSGNVLTAGDTPNANDVFLYDLASGTLKILSSEIGGVFSKISEDGKTVAFASNDFTDVSIYDVTTSQAKSVGDRFGESFPINRLSSETNANGAVRKYAYDAVGNITSITDRDGTIQKFTYDKLNRRTQEQWINAFGNVTRNIASTYNAAGELTQITDPDSTYSYTYDLDGRMLSVSNEGTPNLPTTIMSYSYDNVGNVLSMTDTINGSLGIATTREYDALNRLTVNAQGNKQVDYAYNAISQVITKYRYSDNNLVAETNHIYDSLNRLTNIIHSNGANTISSYAQTYDAASKITSVTGTDGSSTYTYDNTNQLTGADYDFQADESYSYDSNGNRTNDGYVTGVNNQLLEDNKYLYEYDIVGNRTKRTDKSTNEVMEYRWDIRDRLTGITVKNDLGEIIRTAEYTYDVYNQRIAKTVYTDGDGSLAAVTERFVYGSDQNIALVFDENGNVNHRYLFGNDVDQIEADESNGNVLWALTDHLGSVRDVVDDSGTVLNHIVYDAFGGVTSQTNESVVFRYGYTAREFDAESGLQYNRARYLDSFTGRFISEDPISFQGGDSNLYRYVYNSSTNFIDPSGNIPIAFLAPVAVKALTTIVGGVSFLLSLQPSQNQKNSVSPFIDKPEPPDPRPFTFPNPTPTRLPEIEAYPNHISDPNAINRGKDFGDIGKICQNLGFPLNSPSSPNDINKGRNFDLLLPHIFLSKDVQLGGGYKVPEDIYHPSGADGLKQEIIQGVKDAGYKVSKVGRNPDIKIEDGKIVLYSQQNSKVTIKTDIPVSKYPEIIKSK